MTEDDLNNSRSNIGVSTAEWSERVDGVTSAWDIVLVTGEIDKTSWDTALASAADALVLIQWLESKRTD